MNDMNENEKIEEKDLKQNILKCREDSKPINFIRKSENAEILTPLFELSEDSTCSWAKPGEPFGPEKLRSRIEPWLTALCQSEHLSLLLGSGLSNAVHLLGTGELLSGMSEADFGENNEIINTEAKKSAKNAGRENGNIEDQIRVANELLRGLEILGQKNEKAAERAKKLKTLLSQVLINFANFIRDGEKSLITAKAGSREKAFNYLVSFLMSFASRTGTRERLNIFTTNYDRFIEAGAETAGLHLLDRFVGSLSPIFRSSRLDIDIHYNPPGIRGEPRYLEGVARFTKLHGSLDWVDFERTIRRIALPFGTDDIKPFIQAKETGEPDAIKLMIYPNSAKDRETAYYPYIELFRDFAAAACRPNHTLFVFGYSFGDEHINRIIEDMLTIPSTHLVIISFDDPLKRIMKTYEKLGRHAQITLLIGDHIGEFKTLVDHYLPKSAIDRTTFRMAELLKSRWGGNQTEDQNSTANSASKGEEF
jgi:hypothetical protein